MRNRTLHVIAVAMIAGSLVLAGCSKASKPSNPAQNAAAASQKPPLVVPKSFASESAKREFAMKAVDDGYYAEAKPLLEAVAASSPDPVVHINLGVARFNLKDFSGAIEAWSKASQLDPRLGAEMKNNIGNALRDLDKIEEAKVAYREALKLDPTRWTAAVNLSIVLKQEGKLDEAIKVLENALPDNKDIASVNELLQSLRADAKKNASS